jgi:hypothetical protein
MVTLPPRLVSTDLLLLLLFTYVITKRTVCESAVNNRILCNEHTILHAVITWSLDYVRRLMQEL